MRAARIAGSLLALVLVFPPAAAPTAHAIRTVPPHVERVVPRDPDKEGPVAYRFAELPRRAGALARSIVIAETEVASLLLARGGGSATPAQRSEMLSRVGIVSSPDLRRVASRVRDAATLLRGGTVSVAVDPALTTIARGRRVASAVFPGLPHWLDAGELALTLDAAATQHERLALAARFEEMSDLVEDGVYRPYALPPTDVLPGLLPPGSPAASYSAVALTEAFTQLDQLRSQLHAVLDLLAVGVVDRLSFSSPSLRTPAPVVFRSSWMSLGYRRLTALLAALDQIGDPYRFAMRGPDSFDCSGLTSFAWNDVGIALRTSSFSQREQIDRLRSPDELLPGDLVFYERAPRGRDPVGHVAMSLGVGAFIVEANQGAGQVRVAAYENGPLWGFGRVRLAGELSGQILLR
jgi:hypothetical protein